MPKLKLSNLTEAELRLMDVIWEKGRATVAQVASHFVTSFLRRV